MEAEPGVDSPWDAEESPRPFPPLPQGVHLPRQARSRASFDRMVTVAMDLIAAEGLEAATVQRVLERSGAGAGTFYARFDGRDALLAYLAMRFWANADDGWRAVLSPARWAAAGAVEIVHQFTRMLVLWTRAHGTLLRAFLMHAMANPEHDLLDRISVLDNTVADRMCGILMIRIDELDHPEPEQAIRLATLQVIATLRSRIIFAWGPREDGIADDELAGELATAFLRYLGCSEKPESAAPQQELGAKARAVGLREPETSGD